ncbi:hypothetical protein DFH06DRAFT_1485605 [Mycena polygramma]|nr:hypothetical protein DFH06DRAFT_1485605 [Mycena polygramma]
MADAGFFKGTSADQDRRFADKEQKLLKSTKFPAHFDKKVDMRKVNMNVIKPWIAKKIVEFVGFEDDILIGYAMELLDEPAPDPKKMQLLLTSFLAKDAPIFMSALWTLLLEAQTEVTGVPRTFVEEKKEEMRKAREGDTRAIGIVEDGGAEEAGGAEAEDSTMTVEVEAEAGREIQVGVVAVVVEAVVPLVAAPLLIAAPARALVLEIPHRQAATDIVLRRPEGDPRPATSTAPAPLPPPDAEALSVAQSPAPPGRVPSLAPLPQEGADPAPRHILLLRATTAARTAAATAAARPRAGAASRPPTGAPRQGAPRREESPGAAAPSGSRSRSPPHRRSSPETRRGGKMRASPSRSSRSRSRGGRDRSTDSAGGARKMEVDDGELKIKGQAEAERRKSKWDDEDVLARSKLELEKRENELKEKALRNKVLKTRKASNA